MSVYIGSGTAFGGDPRVPIISSDPAAPLKEAINMNLHAQKNAINRAAEDVQYAKDAWDTYKKSYQSASLFDSEPAMAVYPSQFLFL